MWSNHRAGRSVEKRVSQTQRASVSQIQLVEHRWGLGSQTQLDGLSETRPVGPGCHQPGRGSQSVSCGQADRSHGLGPSGTHGICVQSDTARQTDYQAVMASVVSVTQSVSPMRLVRLLESTRTPQLPRNHRTEAPSPVQGGGGASFPAGPWTRPSSTSQPPGVAMAAADQLRLSAPTPGAPVPLRWSSQAGWGQRVRLVTRVSRLWRNQVGEPGQKSRQS